MRPLADTYRPSRGVPSGHTTGSSVRNHAVQTKSAVARGLSLWPVKLTKDEMNLWGPKGSAARAPSLAPASLASSWALPPREAASAHPCLASPRLPPPTGLCVQVPKSHFLGQRNKSFRL